MDKAVAQGPGGPEPPKSAQISGVVIDAMDGHSLRRATVCLRPGADGGYSTTRGERCDETDEKGAFVLAGMLPARYSIGVDREGYFALEPLSENVPSVVVLRAGDDLTGVKLRMQRQGSISGHVVFEDGDPFPGANLELRGPAGENRGRSTTAGEYRFDGVMPGNYRLVVKPPDPSDCDHFLGHRPRVYMEQDPGLNSRTIHVDSGLEATGPWIVMTEAKTHRVSGRIVSEPAPQSLGWRVSIGNRNVMVKNSNGTFDVCGLVPGEYSIRADGRIDGRRMVGDVTVHVDNEDLRNVQIVPEGSASIRARIEIEDGAAVDLSAANILTLSDSFPHGSYPQPRREPDGSFVIDEIYTGDYRFLLSPLPTGSYLKSARLREQDAIDTPVRIRSGESIDSLVFTVSAKANIVTGVVQDETGAKLAGATVILQPDPRHGDRDIHTCFRKADQGGGFTCDNLAPGKYQIAAWRSLPDLEKAWNAVASDGVPVELSEGQHVPIVLPVLDQ
jgi:hypothetical protein